MDTEQIRQLIYVHLIGITDVDAKILAINQLRKIIHQCSPFSNEPVDFVEWVKSEIVEANDYNPNSVAPPEMELLRISINNDGYTQPIVTWAHDGIKEVVDGFHRNRVGKEYQDVKSRIHGYLPVVSINAKCVDRNDRIASTIRHNRARGKHKVEAMSDIVIELKRRNWSDEKIARELGMDSDEVLRLVQITGLAEMFADKEFSEAWTASDDDAEQEVQIVNSSSLNTIDYDQLNAEMNYSTDIKNSNDELALQIWQDRTTTRSMLVKGSKVLARLNLSPRNEWNWDVYTAPMQSGTTATKEEAKCQAEQALQSKY